MCRALVHVTPPLDVDALIQKLFTSLYERSKDQGNIISVAECAAVKQTIHFETSVEVDEVCL